MKPHTAVADYLIVARFVPTQGSTFQGESYSGIAHGMNRAINSDVAEYFGMPCRVAAKNVQAQCWCVGFADGNKESHNRLAF